MSDNPLKFVEEKYNLYPLIKNMSKNNYKGRISKK
jgi:hypothetical protein